MLRFRKDNRRFAEWSISRRVARELDAAEPRGIYPLTHMGRKLFHAARCLSSNFESAEY